MNPVITLICKRVIFYSSQDEDAFFEWLKKIECIQNISGVNDALYLHTAATLPDDELRNLLALFYRYKINMKQLAIFLNDSNKPWFFEGHKGYWYDQVFN